MHTSPPLARPDVHPRKPPRHRMRHTHADEDPVVDDFVHGADVLMRADTRGIEFMAPDAGGAPSRTSTRPWTTGPWLGSNRHEQGKALVPLAADLSSLAEIAVNLSSFADWLEASVATSETNMSRTCCGQIQDMPMILLMRLATLMTTMAKAGKEDHEVRVGK